jgi:glycosyltransferase involved in cell wall biosynthesis
VVEPPQRSAARKAKALLSLEPSLVSYRPASPARSDGAWDVALAEHSYMAPHLRRVDPPAVKAIDFPNLEWRHVLDVARSVSPTRRAYLRVQSGLMRRFERRLLDSKTLCLFVSREELEWARAASARCAGLLVPNVLPEQAVQEADRTRSARAARRAQRIRRRSRRFVYVGNLMYPPNLLSLLRFLERVWPRVLAADRSARLTVIGRCEDSHRRQIGRHQRVATHGFVADPTDALVEADAAVLPLAFQAGTSLRVLLYALAGIPMVGWATAFRGYPNGIGLVARSASDWAELLAADDELERRVPNARATALSIQSDEQPWNQLYERMLQAEAQG